MYNISYMLHANLSFFPKIRNTFRVNVRLKSNFTLNWKNITTKYLKDLPSNILCMNCSACRVDNARRPVCFSLCLTVLCLCVCSAYVTCVDIQSGAFPGLLPHPANPKEFFPSLPSVDSPTTPLREVNKL